jgi:ketosteroid isomerase-like protein
MPEDRNLPIVGGTSLMKQVTQATLLVGLLGVACMLGPRVAGADSDATKEVVETASRFQKAAISNDTQFLAQVFDENITHFHPGEAYRFTGRDRLVREFSSAASRQENLSFEMVEPKVQFASNDVAVLTYYISEHWTEKGTYRSVSEKATEVYVRKNAKWVMIHGHYSVNP